MLVRDVMISPVITISPASPIGKAIELMQQHNFRRLPVVENGQLIGIVTDRDLRQATNSPLIVRERWYSEFLLEAIKVQACMTAAPITVTPAQPVIAAARIMRQHKIGGLPVVEGDAVVGMITVTDLLDCLITILAETEHLAEAT